MLPTQVTDLWSWINESKQVIYPVLAFMYVFYSDRTKKLDAGSQYLKLIAASVTGIFVLLLALVIER